MRLFFISALTLCFVSYKTMLKYDVSKYQRALYFKNIIYVNNNRKTHKETCAFKQKNTISTHKIWDELLQKYVSKNGIVNYKGFKNDHQKLKDYIKILNTSINKETTNKTSALAFWINAYNAFTIDLILRNYPIKSIKDIKKPWQQKLWKLNNKWYNLDMIEHQILRKMNEPKIHFAINCASISCPKLQNSAYLAVNLETQLNRATKTFINDVSKNNISKETIKISKLFKWFSKDFNKTNGITYFLNQFSDIQISNKAKKSFMEYNWNLNE